jgi:hypothetical protein
MESAFRKAAEVAAKAAPEPTDMATPEPAYRAPSKSADMAPSKSADRSRDEITPNSTYVTASATKAPSTPRRRDVRRRSGQSTRNGKNCGCVQYRTQRASSRRRIIRWRAHSLASSFEFARCRARSLGLRIGKRRPQPTFRLAARVSPDPAGPAAPRAVASTPRSWYE